MRKWILCFGTFQKVAHQHCNVLYLFWYFACWQQGSSKCVMSRIATYILNALQDKTDHMHTQRHTKKTIIYFFMALTSLHNFTTVTERRTWQMMWQSRCMCMCVMQIICSTYNICSAWSWFSELLPIYIPAWWFQSVHFDKSYNNLHKGRPTHRTTQSRKPSDRGWPVV